MFYIPTFKEFLTEADSKSDEKDKTFAKADTTEKADAKADTKETGESRNAGLKKEVVSAIDISLDDIFVKLHEAALGKCKGPNIIKNSAIDDDTHQLVSAGHHIISVISEKDPISKTDAIEQLKTYVQWFSGPDLVKKVNEDTVWPLPTKEEKSEKSNESIIPTFSQYLDMILEAGDPTIAGEDPDGPSQEDFDNASKAANSEAESSGADGKDKDKEEEKKKKETQVEAPEDVKESLGWYITYEMKIDGQKETPLKDALGSLAKGIGKGLLNSFTIGGSVFGNSEGKSLGGEIDKFKDMFGKIDPEQLKSRFSTNANQKFKKFSPTVEYWDKNTLFQHLKKVLDQKQKAKIKSADYSLCLRVDHDDDTQKLINTTVIADLVTRSIKGIFKKFKNAIKPEDVVLVNNENAQKDTEGNFEKGRANSIDKDHSKKEAPENKSTQKTNKNNTEKQKTKQTEKPTEKTNEKTNVSDSIVNKYQNTHLVVEEGEKAESKDSKTSDKKDEVKTEKVDPEKVIEDLNKKLNDNAKKEFSDNLTKSDILKKDDVQKYIDEHKATANGKKLNINTDYAFLLDIVFDESKAEKTEESVKKHLNSLMSMLFEDVGDGDDLEDRDEDMYADDSDDSDDTATDDNSNTDSDSEEVEPDDEKAFEDYKPHYSDKVIKTLKDTIDQKAKELKKEPYSGDIKPQVFTYDAADESLMSLFVGKLITEQLLTESGHKGVPEINEIIDKCGHDNIVKADRKKFRAAASEYCGGKNAEQKEIKKEIDGVWKKGEQVEPGLFDEFLKLSDSEKMKEWVKNKFKNYKQDSHGIGRTAQAFWKCLNAMGIPEGEDKAPTAKVNFYDSDPKTNEKTGDPLNKEPIEIEIGTPLASSDDAIEQMDKFEKELKDKAPEGYKVTGWNVDQSQNIEEDTDIIIQYLADEDKDKTFKVTFQYAPDQSKPEEYKEIEKQDVKAEQDAKEPNPPKIDGYKFDKWDKPFTKVITDITVTALYKKLRKIHEVYVLSDVASLVPKPKDDEKKEDPEKTDKKLVAVEKENGKYDFYIIPIKGLKFDNTDDQDEDEIAGGKK